MLKNQFITMELQQRTNFKIRTYFLICVVKNRKQLYFHPELCFYLLIVIILYLQSNFTNVQCKRQNRAFSNNLTFFLPF